MSKQLSTPDGPVEAQSPGKVVVLYKSKVSPDAELALSLESGLQRKGHTVFMDRKKSTGLLWVRELERELQEAGLVVVLISEASAQSELVAYELEVASQISEKRGGLPAILPVRVYYKGPLSEPLAALLQPLEFEWSAEEERYLSRMVLWRSPTDDRELVDLICERLGELSARQLEPSGATSSENQSQHRPPVLEPLGGAVPLESKFYIERATDVAFRTAVDRCDSLILVKGARQMGKTSLLARGLAQAREAGCRIVMTDFQRLQSTDFDSTGDFYRSLTELIADQLDVELPDPERWQRNPNVVFEGFWTGALKTMQCPVLWAVDEFDRLFTSSFGGEVCGLLRSWHNARALDPSLPWRFLTVAIAYATEAHLFINDLNQSPFNVGTRLTLSDLSDAEAEELNERYGRPLAGIADILRLHQLLGGHPYLLRCGMNEMTAKGRGMDLIEELVDEEESVFGEHLRRLLYAVGRDPVVTEALRGLLFQQKPPSMESFYRLRSAGVVEGAGPAEARMRCELYEHYLRRHLATA
jgi:hypothetical protein